MDIELIHADAIYDPLNPDKWSALADALRDAGREREAYAADLHEQIARTGNNPLSPGSRQMIARWIADRNKMGVQS